MRREIGRTLRVIGTTQLRHDLSAVMDDVSEAATVIITRHGQGRAALMQLERYNDLLSRLDFLEDSVDAAAATWSAAVPLERASHVPDASRG